MKESEAPEKLYLSDIQRYFDDKDKTASTIKYADDDIEYIRTDAFIEKACDYLNNSCRRFILTEKDIDDFKNYMKNNV